MFLHYHDVYRFPIEEYTAIIRVAEKDPVVRDKLLKRLD